MKGQGTGAFRSVALMALTTLTACGGGGGGTSAAAPPAANPAATQGFWVGRTDAQTFASGVHLPEGAVWESRETSSMLTTVIRGTVSASGSAFTVVGRSFNPSTGAAAPYSASGSVVQRSSLTYGDSPYSLFYNSAYDAAARVGDLAGRWDTGVAGGTGIRLTLDFASAGALSGSSTAGCTYSGAVSPHAGTVAVFDLSLNEVCPGRAAIAYTGIVTLSSAKDAISAFFANSDMSVAGKFSAFR